MTATLPAVPLPAGPPEEPKRYIPLDFCMVRVPLLPIEDYLRLSPLSSEDDAANLSAPSAPGQSPPGQATLLPADPRIQAALAAASPSLLAALERPHARPRDRARAEGKLLRYQIRMATRPTPFGLCAGVAMGRWAQATDLAIGTTLFRTKTRIDTGWLLEQVHTQEGISDVRNRLRLVTNTTTFVHGDRLFLADPGGGSQVGPDVVVSVRATAIVLHALQVARYPIDHDALVDVIAHESGGTKERALRLVTTLWSQGFFVTDLRPPLTALDPAAHVASRLAGISAAAGVRQRVERGIADCAKCDAAVQEANFTDLKAHLLASGTAGQGRALQIDLAVRLEGCSIQREVGREAVKLAEILLSLSPFPQGSNELASYRAEFTDRYGTAREVPVAELLDPDCGLGPPRPGGRATLAGSTPPSRSKMLLQLAVEALRDGRRSLELGAGDLSRLQTCSVEEATLPPSMELCVLVAARSAAALDAGEFSVVVGPNVGAPAAGRALGRFAGLLGPPAAAALREAARREEAVGAEAVWAELCYLPRLPRSANVVIRPAIRSHEIVVGVGAGVDRDHVVPLDELVVGVRDDRFYLHWTLRDVDVLAVSGHMLNTSRASDLCRLLSHLARDGDPHLSGFDWGAVSDFPFLPRVKSGRLVLAPAQWQIAGTTVRERFEAHEPTRFGVRLASWRDEWEVPRHVHVGSGDRRLTIDLEDSVQVEQLRLDLLSTRRAGRFVVKEVLPSFDELWVQGPEGRYVCELVVPMVLRTPKATRATPTAGSADQQTPSAPATKSCGQRLTITHNDRVAAPGSDWLFVKLYGPRFLEDDLIAGPLRTFATEACDARLATSWFFLRYSDPGSHLRARFNGDADKLTQSLLPQLCAWGNRMVKEGRCTRMVIDTYEREVERFGGVGGVAAAEELFAADTELVLELLYLEHTGQLGIDRICLSVMAIDALLAGLGLNEIARVKWCRDQTALRGVTGEEYRKRRAVLFSLLRGMAPNSTPPSRASPEALLAAYRHAVAAIAHRLRELADGQQLTQPVSVLAQSFVHLLCNRLLGVQRADERRAVALLMRAREALCHIDGEQVKA